MSYQRALSRRDLDVDATPVDDVPMLCTAQRWPLRIVALKRRSSSASSFAVVPVCGTSIGKYVVGTVSGMLPEIDGEFEPALEIRRSWSLPNRALSTPMTYPSVTEPSRLSTPWGVYGPEPVGPPVRSRNAVTTIGPTPSTLVFLMTKTDVCWNVPVVPAPKMLTPMYSALASIPSVS